MANKLRGPAQRTVLDGDVILLRKVNFKKMPPGILERIKNTNLRPKELEGDQPWFLDGYVAGEHPRDIGVTKEIMKATQGFAIAKTETGEIMAEFSKTDVVKAENTAHSAKVTLALNVDLPDEEEEIEEEEDD
jgi:hypothetical protein